MAADSPKDSATRVPEQPLSLRELARKHDGRWQGDKLLIRCPAHDDRNPSCLVSPDPEKSGGVSVHCFAGCDWRDVKDALGLNCRHVGDIYPSRQVGDTESAQVGHSNRDELVKRVLGECQPIGGQAADYLRERGIHIPLPDCLRLHPHCWHTGAREAFPALIAVATTDNGPTGLQRTYLAPDGRSKAPVDPAKMSLGRIRGAAVRLTPPAGTLWLTEGVEDGLSLVQMMHQAVWATLGTSGMATVELPDVVERVILAPDNDPAGQASIDKAARRFHHEGRDVRIARPPMGQDWNDVLGEYEERAAILQFDALQPVNWAEDAARRAVIGGRHG
ncbi:DUF7146 domain-containing protein [Rhodovibrio sodomensis]|nr:toprim domain-containing protein [Rhodovibrio sodomensis]